MKPLFLSGFMGSGKTSVGKRLAVRLGWEFMDTDAELEKRVGKKISRIFREDGEKVFRQHESLLVREICQSAGECVIALGGGSLINEDNLNRVLAVGSLIYLLTSIEEIRKRVGMDPNRPLMRGGNLDELLTTRAPGYLAASYIVTTDGVSEDEVAEWIMRILSHPES